MWKFGNVADDLRVERIGGRDDDEPVDGGHSAEQS